MTVSVMGLGVSKCRCDSVDGPGKTWYTVSKKSEVSLYETNFPKNDVPGTVSVPAFACHACRGGL